MLYVSSIGAYVDQCEWLERATPHPSKRCAMLLSMSPRRSKTMKTKFLRALIVLSAFAMAVMPMQAETHHCSNAAAAGQWAYTYTGSILTQSGWVPAASVGHFHQDAAGNITGSQVRTVG